MALHMKQKNILYMCTFKQDPSIDFVYVWMCMLLSVGFDIARHSCYALTTRATLDKFIEFYYKPRKSIIKHFSNRI